MNQSALSYRGPGIDDFEILDELPHALRELLDATNGFVQFDGGLHVRGACLDPAWHSLREAMHGERAFHRLYPDIIDPTDVPFAQDCGGDQFVLRGGEVHQLAAEVGELDPLDMTLREFLDHVQENPVESLCMHPLLQFMRDGGKIAPGRLLLVYPPFCTGQSGGSASLKAVDAGAVIAYHADLAKQIQNLGDGEDLPFKVGP